MIKVSKHTGVYFNESATKKHQGKPDRCYYVTYKDPNKKLVWHKVGWSSEGYTPQMAAVVRGRSSAKSDTATISPSHPRTG